MKLNTHVILVSAQPIPNLTPMLDDAIKPTKVLMLVSDDMRERAKALENIFKPRGIAVELYTVPDPWNAGQISGTVLDILSRYPEGDIALNATGGTKLMAIAAYEAFRREKYPIYYVHPEFDRLLWLSPKQIPHELAGHLNLRDYLMAYGADQVEVVSESQVSQEIKALTQQLIIGIDRYADDLGTLNYLAQQADNPRLSSEIRFSPQSRPKLWELLELFKTAGICSLDNNVIRFPDEQTRFIANGGWLEMHVYALCSGFKQKWGVQDLASNITIHRYPSGKADVKNEIDVGFIHANKLHLIECKTKSIGKDADMLYKLNSLRDLMGGLQGRAMLISFNVLDKAGRARAKELKIELCSKMELQNLQHHIQKWIFN